MTHEELIAALGSIVEENKRMPYPGADCVDEYYPLMAELKDLHAQATVTPCALEEEPLTLRDVLTPQVKTYIYDDESWGASVLRDAVLPSYEQKRKVTVIDGNIHYLDEYGQAIHPPVLKASSP